MKIYSSKENRLTEVIPGLLPPQDSVWIDLLCPSEQERKVVEELLSVKIPTREEMQEIESSSRLYKENDALIMTVNMVKKEESHHRIVNITFLLKANLLVTLRYDETVPFSIFLKSSTTKPTIPVDSALSILLGLLEVMIEKIADTLESISATIELLSQQIFKIGSQKDNDLSGILINMGLQGEINSKARESLSTISRMVGYLKFNIGKEDQKRFENRLETLNIDAVDLKDHSAFLAHKIGFILDASLGLINIEQNKIIKIFSIAAVVLLPPTLVASIYGMNFLSIPELQWKLGYPIALCLMVLSALLPYWYFKRKGWL